MRIFERKKFLKSTVGVFAPTFNPHQASHGLFMFELRGVYDSFVQYCKIAIKNVTHLRK
jgi:hypothetical protein